MQRVGGKNFSIFPKIVKIILLIGTMYRLVDSYLVGWGRKDGVVGSEVLYLLLIKRAQYIKRCMD